MQVMTLQRGKVAGIFSWGDWRGLSLLESLTRDVHHERGLCFSKSSYITSSLLKHCPNLIVEHHFDDDLLGDFVKNSSQADGFFLYVDCSSPMMNWLEAGNLQGCMMMGRHHNITVILDHLQVIPLSFYAQIDFLFVLPFTDHERAVLVRKIVGTEYTADAIMSLAKNNLDHVLLFNLYKKAHEKIIVEFYQIKTK